MSERVVFGRKLARWSVNPNSDTHNRHRSKPENGDRSENSHCHWATGALLPCRLVALSQLQTACQPMLRSMWHCNCHLHSTLILTFSLSIDPVAALTRPISLLFQDSVCTSHADADAGADADSGSDADTHPHSLATLTRTLKLPSLARFRLHPTQP